MRGLQKLQIFRLWHFQDIKLTRVAKVANVQTLSFSGYQGCEDCKSCKVSDFSRPDHFQVSRSQRLDSWCRKTACHSEVRITASFRY